MGCSVPIVKKECLLSSPRGMYLRQEYMDPSRKAVKPTWIGRRFMSFRGEGGSIKPRPWSVRTASWSLDVPGSLACQTFRDVGVFSDVYQAEGKADRDLRLDRHGGLAQLSVSASKGVDREEA